MIILPEVTDFDYAYVSLLCLPSRDLSIQSASRFDTLVFVRIPYSNRNAIDLHEFTEQTNKIYQFVHLLLISFSIRLDSFLW